MLSIFRRPIYLCLSDFNLLPLHPLLNPIFTPPYYDPTNLLKKRKKRLKIRKTHFPKKSDARKDKLKKPEITLYPTNQPFPRSKKTYKNVLNNKP
jgi:hypothetical protein